MKSGWKSKTLWFNVIALLVAVAGPVLADAGFTGELPASWGLFVPALIGAVNLILRYFFTNTSLRD